MNHSAPHPVLAWCLDVWLLASIVRAAANVVDSDLWSVSGVLFALVVPTVYHVAWSASARFLSLGERVFGRALVEDRKVWLNPYGTSRTLLFGCAAYGLFVQFSVSPRHEIAGSFELPVELLLLGIAAGSLIVLGRGHAWALLGIVGVPGIRTNRAHAAAVVRLDRQHRLVRDRPR